MQYNNNKVVLARHLPVESAGGCVAGGEHRVVWAGDGNALAKVGLL